METMENKPKELNIQNHLKDSCGFVNPNTIELSPKMKYLSLSLLLLSLQIAVIYASPLLGNKSGFSRNLYFL